MKHEGADDNIAGKNRAAAESSGGFLFEKNLFKGIDLYRLPI